MLTSTRPIRAERPPGGDGGFTMVELVVVMSIMALLMSIGAFGFTSWRNTSQHQGTAKEMVSTLRNASTRAVSEGRTYCVEIGSDGRSYSVWRYACSTAAPAAGAPAHVRVTGVRRTNGSHVKLTTTVPLPAGTTCPVSSSCIYFYPRGTATPGTINVTSSERPSKSYTVRVEGLTARVYL